MIGDRSRQAGPSLSGATAPRCVLLIFVDGVGIGPDDPAINPWLSAHLPCLHDLLGGVPTLDQPRIISEHGVLVPADATLGLPGLPQSGTGHTALFSGINAAAEFGRHFGPWVPTALRPALAERNLLVRTQAAGRRAAFANAFPTREPGRRPAGPTLVAHAAGLLTRGPDALLRSDAVASSIVNTVWQKFAPEIGMPDIIPEVAGRTLARIVDGADLTLFAHYDTDFAGHRRELPAAVAALERVDRFLGGLLSALPADALVVIASDHGNLEDIGVGHTRNPVPVIATGPGKHMLAERVAAITDVTPALLHLLEVS